MNNLPDASDLLAIARETLLAELLPRIGDDTRYTTLMIANAMSIAAREAAAADAPSRAALVRLANFYGESPPQHDSRSVALAQYERRLAQDIRSGHFDAQDGRQRSLLQHLRDTVTDRLRISNPKSLGVGDKKSPLSPGSEGND